MENCIFCKIIAGEIPSKKVYEDEQIYAFYDVNPAAPVHVLVIPKMHIPSLNFVAPENLAVIARIFEVVPKIAQDLKIADNGYRVVNNCGSDGGQTVDHIHFHVLAGRNLGWPPG